MGSIAQIAPADFVSAMTAHWEALGNVPSAPLQSIWSVMHSTFEEAKKNGATPGSPWLVLQPPTGSGKTQGLCVYAALSLQHQETLGILIVTRTIVQANDIACTIKSLAGLSDDTPRVLAKHSENKATAQAMADAEVLVVTHQAYTNALEGLTKDTDGGRWSNLIEWNHGKRCLTVIDEALASVIDEYEVRADEVRFVLGLIDKDLRDEFPSQVAALEEIVRVLDDIRAALREEDADTSSRFVRHPDNAAYAVFPESFSMAGLRAAMRELPYDVKVHREENALKRVGMADRVDQALASCEAILRRWAYYTRKGNDDTLQSSLLLIPDDLPGPVVLDATASQNFLWQLLGEKARIIPTPQDARNYEAVTLHVARATGTGKTKWKERAATRIPRLLADLENRVSYGNKVLVCLHKSLRARALNYEGPFSEFAVANWGAIDGKNDWQDFNTIVIASTPYRDDTWAKNAFIALQGLPRKDWLTSPKWKSYSNVCEEMLRCQASVEIIQAINRGRCRRVIDGQGNCAPMDVFIVLPGGPKGDTILNHIKKEMPGIEVQPWDFELDGEGARIRKGSSHEALIEFMKMRLPGETSFSKIRSELGLTPSQLRDLKTVLRTMDHPLTQQLADLGVSYVSNGRGRAPAFLLKR